MPLRQSGEKAKWRCRHRAPLIHGLHPEQQLRQGRRDDCRAIVGVRYNLTVRLGRLAIARTDCARLQCGIGAGIALTSPQPARCDLFDRFVLTLHFLGDPGPARQKTRIGLVTSCRNARDLRMMEPWRTGPTSRMGTRATLNRTRQVFIGIGHGKLRQSGIRPSRTGFGQGSREMVQLHQRLRLHHAR